jgi:hypothetical protein
MIDPEVQRFLNDLQAGRNVTVGEVSLAVAPATTTTVPCQGCSTGSVVLLSPVNAAGGTEFGAGTWFVTPGKQQFVITHSANAATRKWRYAVFTNTRPIP